jgi:hypothetical protein
MAVVRLHDAWARFCRELIIRSASVTTESATGFVSQPAPDIERRQHVLPKWAASFKKPKPAGWEPRWGDPTEALDAANRVGVNNAGRIASGLAATPNPLDDLRRVRNFLAHRGHKGADDVAQIAVALGEPRGTPVHELIVVPVPPGETVFMTWVRGLEAMAYLSVQ